MKMYLMVTLIFALVSLPLFAHGGRCPPQKQIREYPLGECYLLPQFDPQKIKRRRTDTGYDLIFFDLNYRLRTSKLVVIVDESKVVSERIEVSSVDNLQRRFEIYEDLGSETDIRDQVEDFYNGLKSFECDDLLVKEKV